MKKFVCLFLILTLIFSACVSANAKEPASDEPTTSNKIPQLSHTQNISITFFVSDGKAYVSYFCASNKNDISVRVLFEKKTLGIFWVNIGEEKQETTDKKYLSGSCSVPVDGNGEYRVTVDFDSAGEKMRKTAVYEYDEKILLGDANSDGVIRANDTRLILRFSARLQKYSNEQKKICDIDKNDLITAADARIVLRLSAKLI